MNSPAFRQIALLILLMIFIFIAARGGIQDTNWNDLLAGVSASVLATIISVYFLNELDKAPLIASINKAITNALSQQNPSHFGRVDRNLAMGEQYWIDLIKDLDTSIQPVWFVGNKLSRWRLGASYRPTLREKLLRRLRAVSKGHDNPNQEKVFMIYIFLTDSNAILEWKEFFSEIINELVVNQPAARKKQTQEKCWNRVIIGELPPEMVKYSVVLCGDRLAVTHYTSLGRLEDSPTLDNKYASILRRLYLDDLERLRERVNIVAN